MPSSTKARCSRSAMTTRRPFSHLAPSFTSESSPNPFPIIATAHGPGLAPNFDAASSYVLLVVPGSTWICQRKLFSPSRSLATGTMRLDPDMFVDYTDLNKQDFRAEVQISSGYMKKGISEVCQKTGAAS